MSHKQIEAERITIYCVETDRHDGHTLYEWLMEQAMAAGLSGCTAVRAMSGFGKRQRMHHQRLLSISDALPIMVQVIDTVDKIDSYVDAVHDALIGYTYIREKVRYHQPNM